MFSFSLTLRVKSGIMIVYLEKGHFFMKILRFIALALLVCLVLVGCVPSVQTDYPADETSTADEENKPSDEVISYTAMVIAHKSAVANVEYIITDTESFTATPAEEETVSVNGEEITGVFEKTEYVGWNYFPTKFYTSDDAEFTVDHRNYLSGFSKAAPVLDGTENTLSRDECTQKAIDFIKDVMVKEEKFTVDDYVVGVSAAVGFDNCYNVNFIKLLGEFMTMDRATVTVSVTGEIVAFESSMFGMIKKTAEVEFDLKAVELAVKNKLDLIFERSQKDFTDITYSDISTSNTLVLLKNGTLALLCSARVHYKDTKSSVNSTIYESIDFIIQ